MDCGPLGSSAHGISQARILEWVAIFFSRGSSRPGIEPAPPGSPALAGRFFTTESPGMPPESFYKNTTEKVDKIETLVQPLDGSTSALKSYYHLLTQNTLINDVVFFICLKLWGCLDFQNVDKHRDFIHLSIQLRICDHKTHLQRIWNQPLNWELNRFFTLNSANN